MRKSRRSSARRDTQRGRWGIAPPSVCQSAFYRLFPTGRTPEPGSRILFFNRLNPNTAEVPIEGASLKRVGEAWLLRNEVGRMRRKLGDDAADPRYIVTEPRVGYRMGAGDAEEPLSYSPGAAGPGATDRA